MYKLGYLPIALNDMIEIVKYISAELGNPTAAERLSENMIKSAEQLLYFPYAHEIYFPPKKLKYEYRKLHVQNYIMFYIVSEENKTVTISRVIYAKRSYQEILL